MFKSLRTRLILVYSFIILITIFTVDVLILSNYFQSRFEERAITYFTYGNIAANIVSQNPDDMLYISRILEQYTATTGARFLLINTSSVVAADSANRYTGQPLTNPQIREALAGSVSRAVYEGENKILQLAVPITSGSKDNMQVNGAIMVSVNIDELFTAYEALRLRVLVISLLAGLSGIFFSFIAAYRLSSPLNKLITFSKRLSRGHLGEEIKIKRNDEIGQLADTINSMSAELHRIEANRRKFIGDVSHELKTPLASIKALVEALMIGQKSPEGHMEFLGDVVTEVDRLSALISRLLTLTRLEEETLNREYVCVSDIVKDTVRVLTPLAASHNVNIKNDAQMDIRVMCDKNLVREMLVNLLDNSIKYRDKHKAVNRIELKDFRIHNTYRLEISDNGIGIPEGDLPRIFEGFFRSEPSRSREIEGYGMGLTIVKRIISLHGWDISVKSQPGNGTVIVLIIPLS
jgi:signal transduction histidine kinase